VLLFRKFAADFAEKYRMPAIKLTEDGKQLLSSYYWNGNVRQLKNITEQISVIEQQRDINSQILRNYLPKDEVERFPALLSASASEKRTFNNEREILYQVLFDMKKDMNDLKKLVHDIMNNQPVDIQSTDLDFQSNFRTQNDIYFNSINNGVEIISEKNTNVDNVQIGSKTEDVEDYQDADDYHVLESTSKPVTLAEMEKKMISDSLNKFKGKRKFAAIELNVSQRTLYRKIKEYGLDEL